MGVFHFRVGCSDPIRRIASAEVIPTSLQKVSRNWYPAPQHVASSWMLLCVLFVNFFIGPSFRGGSWNRGRTFDRIFDGLDLTSFPFNRPTEVGSSGSSFLRFVLTTKFVSHGLLREKVVDGQLRSLFLHTL